MKKRPIIITTTNAITIPKKVRNLLQNHEIEDIGTNQREYRISAISVYRYLTQKTSKTRTDMNKPPAKRKRNSVSTLSNYP